MNTLLEDYPIVITQDIIWSDMDAYEHVNNAVYFRFFEDVRMHTFEKIGVEEYRHAHGIGPILASTKADYKAPLKYPDTISVGAKIVDIENKKLRMLYRVVSHNLQVIAAEGEGLVVYYDYNINKSCPIPDELKQKMLSL